MRKRAQYIIKRALYISKNTPLSLSIAYTSLLSDATAHSPTHTLRHNSPCHSHVPSLSCASEKENTHSPQHTLISRRIFIHMVYATFIRCTQNWHMISEAKHTLSPTHSLKHDSLYCSHRPSLSHTHTHARIYTLSRESVFEIVLC